MGQNVLLAVFAAAAGVVTTLLATFYGPAWKIRLDRRRERQIRSEVLLANYAEPLAGAAYDLQSRLYNIVSLNFLGAYYGTDEYAELSTLWLLAQYLAWVEILRREVQLLDFGDAKKTSEVQKRILQISRVLASDRISDRSFRIFRARQRAIGELMVIDRSIRGQQRADCMGYAQFCHQLSDERFCKWFDRPRAELRAIAQSQIAPHQTVRLATLQNELLGLIDFFDPGAVRFPRQHRERLPIRAEGEQ